jgi:chemotaxis protein methyltransferase CheR
MAMVLRDALAEPAWRAARVLATDISARILARARAGVYADDAIGDVDPALAKRHFAREPGGGWSVAPGLRAAVRFAPLNLMGPWPMRGPFHAIFCRNVMIYFDKPTQASLVARYYDLLAPGGYLFVGHSESLSAVDHAFAYVRPAVYRK